MIEIGIKTVRQYKVYIERGLLEKAGSIVRETAGGHKALLVTDSNAGPLYADAAEAGLVSSGYEVHRYVMEAGEKSKNLTVFGNILEFMAERGFSRKDTAVALGGGVVGDMTGFCASAYMRGIPYVQIPTTVLAAVDSSVGGKTGVDLPAGKNLAGAFWQPKAVICDPDTFDSLPRREYAGGCAEILKYGMIADPSLLDMDEDMETVIEKCVGIKADIVGRDEFEAGERRLLNFGHTIGHAVEKASAYEMHHGEAVAVGMAAICDIAAAEGICGQECRDRLLSALEKQGLPSAYNMDNKEIAANIRRDKKASGDGIDMVFPLEAGKCVIKRVELNEVEKLLEKINCGHQGD